MPDKKSNRAAARVEADALKAKMSAALEKSLPPPAIESERLPAPSRFAEEPSRSKATTVAVPVNELAQADDFVAWLRQQSGKRNIGSSTLVRVLLRTPRRDEATLQALREVIALDGRGRRERGSSI